MVISPEKKTMILDNLTKLRVSIDGLMNMMLNQVEKSAETTLAYRSLQMSKAWLGKMKGVMLGPNTSPYKPAEHPKDIPETSDTATDVMQMGTDHLANINLMRSEIDIIEGCIKTQLSEIINDIDVSELFLITPYFNAKQSIEEAGMWLGFELSRIRDKYYRNNPLT